MNVSSAKDDQPCLAKTKHATIPAGWNQSLFLSSPVFASLILCDPSVCPRETSSAHCTVLQCIVLQARTTHAALLCETCYTFLHYLVNIPAFIILTMTAVILQREYAVASISVFLTLFVVRHFNFLQVVANHVGLGISELRNDLIVA